MATLHTQFPCVIKELCKNCYENKRSNSLKIENNLKRCSYDNCNGKVAIYVDAKNFDNFVRDFQNNQQFNSSKTIKKCNLDIRPCDMANHISRCSFAHNEFEYFVWTLMKNEKSYKISEIYKNHMEPFVYKSSNTNVTRSQNTSRNPVVQQLFLNYHLAASQTENEIIKEAERKKIYFCWFCLKEITSEPEIKSHVKGHKHQAYYEADKKRRWYFKMPPSPVISLCSQSDCTYSQCKAPHSEDELQEMIARLKFRNFMTGFVAPVEEKKISRWPSWLHMSMPKFPSNINCYKSPIQIFVTVTMNTDKLHNLLIYLRDDESRPFFKLIKTNDNQIIKTNGQCLTAGLNSNDKSCVVEFGLEFHPLYSSTYYQQIELQLEKDKSLVTYQKGIRVDVGTDKHLDRLKFYWSQYENVIYSTADSRNEKKFRCYLPFDISETRQYDILNEYDIKQIMKVIPNYEWINTTVASFNYCDWMRDMMILEELEQRKILSQLQFRGTMVIKGSIFANGKLLPANNGKLFGEIRFDADHDWSARELIIKNVLNCFIIFNESSLELFSFESQLVDSFRYDNVEGRTIKSVILCLSKATMETVKLKNGDKKNVQIYFNFDRLVFERRHKSLNNIPQYDKLIYNPLACPSFTRVPYGEETASISFKPHENLNEQQRRLPRLVLRKLEYDEIPLPFILIGAFGTGKSMVFAETVMNIMDKDPEATTLLCTRSYSAGEFYLEIFKRYIKNLANKIKLIKHFRRRGIKGLNEDMIIYSDEIDNSTFFNNRVFITTLDNAVDSLSTFGSLFKEHSMFKYIFVDEAAQVLEIDAIMVYQFGNQKSKFIFAGDLLQTRPELYNTTLKKFSIPIICRLHKTYSVMPDYAICLHQVYRTHPKIVEYLTKAIYFRDPLSSLMKPSYPLLVPMKFVDSNGFDTSFKESFDQNLYSYNNLREINIIVSDILLLNNDRRYTFEMNRILVCSPFYSQVKVMREKLRNEKLGGVVVELPSNIQGREFDAVFISTVLTSVGERFFPIFHPTFHSTRNLINLVISRAKHFVQVVGDRNSLTSQNTANEWNMFIDMCKELNEEDS